MFPDDRAGDRKAKTYSTCVRIPGVADPVEWLEHLLPLAARDSRAFIFYGYPDPACVRGERYVGLAAIFDGIVHEVGDRPPHGSRPTGNRHVAWSREGHLLAGVHGILADAIDQGA